MATTVRGEFGRIDLVLGHEDEDRVWSAEVVEVQCGGWRPSCSICGRTIYPGEEAMPTRNARGEYTGAVCSDH